MLQLIKTVQKRVSRKIKVGYNVYTATTSLGIPFSQDADASMEDDFTGKITSHWTESVDNGLIGMKKAEY